MAADDPIPEACTIQAFAHLLAGAVRYAPHDKAGRREAARMLYQLRREAGHEQG
jgi:hypothetical protein